MTASAFPAVARTWALTGTALIGAGVVAVLALHVVTFEEIDPVRRTLSQYGGGAAGGVERRRRQPSVSCAFA